MTAAKEGIMKKTVFCVLCGLLAFACSGDKGTDPPPPAKFSLDVSSLNLTGVATAVWPVNGRVTLTNITTDSLTFNFVESCNWLTASRSSARLGGGDTAQIRITATMASLCEGHHVDTLTILDASDGSKAGFLLVDVAATPDSTFPVFLNPTDSSTLVNEYFGYYCYQFASAWILECHSNSGNPIKVFAYEAWSAEKLEGLYFDDRTVLAGEVLRGRIVFSGCLAYPPPLRTWWTVKVGYRVGTEIRWASHVYQE